MTTSMPAIPLFPETAIVELPARQLVGLKIRTSMQAAAADCPALWERFVPFMWKVHGLESCGYACPSYGLSLDADMRSGEFTYWASIEQQSHFADPAQWPAGFESITLPAGPYAGTGLASMEKLTEAYTHLYGPWGQSQHGHTLNFSGISFEYYDERYLKNGSLDVFAPLQIK